MSLFHTASGFALRSPFDSPEGIEMGTAGLNISYHRPATDGLTAEAEVVRAGKSVGGKEEANLQ